MKAPRLRAWHKELKIMEQPEDIFTRDNIYMLLNEDDYIWMRTTEHFDKNGKEIFEGDEIETWGSYTCEVFWRPALAAFWIRWTTEDGQLEQEPFILLYEEWDDSTEIIGNIYENPELMEKQ